MKCSLFKTIEKRKRTMMTPRVAAIHDMSGFGRCSLTVAIPILSAMGVQCCPLPTAFLSTHTGGFEGFTFLDMTDEMSKVADHWASLGLTFQAVYSGFLGSERQIGVVEDFICRFRGPDTVVVVDPVMVATSGDRLITEDAVSALKELLLPLATVLTPNIPEAEILSGMTIRSAADMEAAARAISEQYGCAVLCKGGHQINDADDLLWRCGSGKWFHGKRINNPNTHGTGCTLSSAIASNLAKGFDLDTAVERAKAYISGALGAMLDLGRGSGPMNHMFDLKSIYCTEKAD